MVLHLGGKFLSFLAWLRAKRLLSDWMLGTVNMTDWYSEHLGSRRSCAAPFGVGRTRGNWMQRNGTLFNLSSDNNRVRVWRPRTPHSCL
ncbi:hypothetical protein TNCV_858551 [Trichonephila clavipes]|nr:hypothetical protein TNCV_858551 [Trichonephila clavipes]